MPSAEDAEHAEQYKKQGNEAFAAGNMEEAVAMFSMAMELDESNAVLYSNRSAAFARQAQYQMALADAERAVELRPEWAKAWSRKGAALEGLGQLDEAVELYKKAVGMDPKNAGIRQSLTALTEKMLGKRDRERMEQDEAQVRAQELQELGNEAKKDGRYQRAVEHYTEALGVQKMDERRAVLFSNRSAVHLLLSDPAAALADADEAVRLRGDWARGHGRRAAALYDLKRYTEAVEAYSEAIALDSTNGQLLKAYQQAQRAADYDKEFGHGATAAAAARTAQSPEDRAAELKKKGNAALQAGDVEDAVAFYTKALEHTPNNHILFSNRAAARLKLGEWSKAVDDANECVRLEPAFAKGYARKAQALEAIASSGGSVNYKILKGAAKAWAQAVEQDAENAEYLQRAHEVFEQIEEEERRRAEEEAAREEEAQKQPQHNPLLGAVVAVEQKDQQLVIVEDPDVLADRKFENGEYRGAIGYYTKAIKADPKVVSNYMKRGVCWSKVGRLLKAVADFEEVLKLSPEDLEAHAQKGQVLMQRAANAAEQDPDEASALYAESVAAYEAGQRLAKEPEAVKRFAGLVAHARNEKTGFDMIKADKIDLLRSTKAKSGRRTGKLDWKNMPEDEKKRRQADIKRKTEQALFEDSYLQKQMRRGQGRAVGLAPEKKRAKKFRDSAISQKFTYGANGL